ncbi:unnamed protein product [Blepharisma stoltei]|uniref:Translin-associated factor X-interacting protein 1 N-terminal domain-containing protein n=1 Tax=Blepharisma stoltei TaxID=1481888 RepID=A0AAU9JPM6_9CILI|nr:unnamed protein product [Blepharisma stoltei]
MENYKGKKASPLLPNLREQIKSSGYLKERPTFTNSVSSPRMSYPMTDRFTFTKNRFHKYTSSFLPSEKPKSPHAATDNWISNRNQTPTKPAHFFKISEPEFRYHEFNSPFIKTKSDIITTLRELMVTTQRPYDSSQTINRLKLVLKTLEILSNEEGKYQAEMKYIVDEIKNAIFANKEEIKPKLLEIVYEKHIDALSDLDGYVPYSYLYYILNEINEGYIGKELQNEKNIEELKKKHVEEIEEINKKTAELQRIIDGKLEGNVDLADEYQKLKADFDRKLRELKIAIAKTSELDSKLKNCKKALKDAEFLNSDINDELKKTNEVNTRLREQLRLANVEYEKLKDKYENFSGGYSTIIYKLKQSYESNDELEMRISQLLKEKTELSVRAAAGYEELTPRPNLEPLFKEMGENFPKGSTIDRIGILFSHIVDWKNKNNKVKKTKKPRAKSPRRETSPYIEEDDKRTKESSLLELYVPSSPRRSVQNPITWGSLLQP